MRTPEQPADSPHARRVLVVDDEALIRWALVQALSDHGCVVTEASNSREARAAFGAGSFDVVVMDCRLPDTVELELLRDVKALAPSSHVVMMTADSTPDILERAAALGASCVLEKPLDLEVACQRILGS